MYIQHVEVGNFRKLKAVRIDFAEEKTVFVGANNSGKTSAMVALRRFLLAPGDFSIYDFTLCHWSTINAMGDSWEQALGANQPLPKVEMDDVLPFLDIWLNVANGELHHVQKLLPTLDWAGGTLGVRLRFEPKDREVLQRAYLKARDDRAKVLLAPEGDAVPVGAAPGPSTEEEAQFTFPLWPQSLTDFLTRRHLLRGHFAVKAYLLDPARLADPVGGYARPQNLSQLSEPVEGDPFKGLIQINEISAQRGFGQASGSGLSTDVDDGSDLTDAPGGRKLSAQLRTYYARHLDPSEHPEPKDLAALKALHEAERAFEKRLNDSFEAPLKELEEIGYPGVTDPKLTINTRIKATDGLNHGAAVQYEVPTHAGASAAPHRLPEDSNGLGYQNLVSMVFALMGFRDRWMRVGKAADSLAEADAFVPPLHLVLIEEPEAHLHAQVQQVFINKAYEILRKHKDLGESTAHRTQLVVSTHSSHLAHECEFSSLRYFRRMPAPKEQGAVPLTSVVNLSTVFGDAEPTQRFVKRYLKATHCDLFFADGAVLVEGPAERMLVPHFVREHQKYEHLQRCYITWLEIGGSHAHRLRSLLEHLGLTTLVITDLDAMAAKGSTDAVVPQRSASLRTRNQTLKTWLPNEESLDALLSMTADRLVLQDPSGYGIRVAYQQPVGVIFKSAGPVEAIPNTFEDALLYANIDLFQKLTGAGLIDKFKTSLKNSADVGTLATELHKNLGRGSAKAELALELMYSDEIDAIKVPDYIDAGLLWLADQLKRKEMDENGKLEVTP